MEKAFTLRQADCLLHGVLFEQTDAPILVLLHGGPGSGMKPLLELPAFQELNRRFSTVYFDQRGCGASCWDLSLGLAQEQLTADVEAVVQWAKEALPSRPVYLWGGSFGGLLGLLYLDRYPNSVEKAVISSPAISPASFPDGQGFLCDALQGLADATGKPELLRDVDSLDELTDNPQWEEFLHSLDGIPEGMESVFYICAMGKWFLNCNAGETLPRIKVPLRLLQGMEDPLCPSDCLLEAYKTCENPLVSLRMFSPCGHSLFEDCEREFVEEIQGFCQSLPCKNEEGSSPE